MKKKVLSFDLDGTLVDAAYGDIVWNTGIPEEYAKKYGMTFDEAKALVRKQYESVGDADLLWYDIDYWIRGFDLPITSQELLNRYETSIETLPYAVEAIEELQKKYHLIIASNAARIFVEKELDSTGLGRYFSKTVSATTDFKLVKKNTAFYEKLCAFLGVLPEDIVHVGDHPVFDYDAPTALGIEAYHVADKSSQDAADACHCGRRTIEHLGELLGRL